MDELSNLERLNDIYKTLLDTEKLAAKSEETLNKLRISNAQKLLNLKLDQIASIEKRQIDSEQKINEKLLTLGFKTSQIKEQREKKYTEKLLKEEQKQKAKDIKSLKNITDAERKQKLATLKKEYDEKIKLANKFNAAEKKEESNKFKEAKKRYDELRKEGYSRAEAQQAIQNEGFSTADVIKGNVSKNLTKAADAVFDFAKKLSSDIKDIAYTQTEIDTRLYGSRNEKQGGSYWKKISWDIGANVAMSPFVKQADVVDNLKSLVGQGIAYNVEQRAFLDTISDKIATTFEATDATLLKLVRIQQADTTAARLGMESALTAFLNNMYETTEYMTEAADSIRANIYEASALMGAKEATEFEFQVQKWMGSLYSAGFSNTNGLSGALGKLAAGDISAVTDGGYGNLLVMAANKANLSIAEILAEGLDDTETNKLMKAMVEYLGGIYDETKNSKVVAQQFANVYGLTASDLKAAANLAKSTGAISKQGASYGSLMGQLNNMANSMWSRTSMGEMMENLWGNFQYGMAEGIANNPVLYATYNIASLLDSVAGGIAIPALSVMGNMVDLETTVADLMRVTAVGGSALAGIGKLVSGLAAGSGGGFSGSGMLKAFGVENNLTTISYGSGTGFETLTSGASTSSSGYVGNSDSSDVQNKTMTDAQEDGENQLSAKQDETDETKLSTVDEHIVQIITMLENLSDGNSLRVVVNEKLGWTL